MVDGIEGHFDGLVGEVLRDACGASGLTRMNDVGLLLATTKGDTRREVEWMRKMDAEGANGWAVPTLGGDLKRMIKGWGFGGPSYVVSTACTSGLVALIEGAMLLLDGEAERMIVVGADAPEGFVRSGFQALKAISPTRCRPFDRERDGLMLGAAAGVCVLRVATGVESGCVISGWGIANDATHMTAPDREAGGLVRAIRQALKSASLGPEEIDVVFAHGTGTKYNDAMEAVAIEKVFLATDCRPTVTAVKGLIGHTLGAAGLVEAVLAVEMIRRQQIPGIVGLRVPGREDIDFALNSRSAKVWHVLKIASGFGGMNAAVVISQAGKRR